MHRPATVRSAASSPATSEVHRRSARLPRGLLHADAGRHRPAAERRRPRRAASQGRDGALTTLQTKRYVNHLIFRHFGR